MPKGFSPAVAELLGRQIGVVTRAQLAACGCRDRTAHTLIRNGHLLRLHPGAYVSSVAWADASDQTRHCMQLLAVQLTTPDAVGYCRTAATARGLPVRHIPPRPQVVRSIGRSVLASAAVRREQLPADAITEHAGLAVTTVPRTVVDVAAQSTLADALITADAALRRGVSRADLADEVDRRSGRAGMTRAGQAVARADPRAESPLESLSRGRMYEQGMPIPLSNVVLRCGSRWVRVDHLWVEDGVVGECDGKQKYADTAAASHVIWLEKRRHEWIEDLTFEVARWGYPEVADDGDVMESRYRRAVERQRRSGFRWPGNVTLEIPELVNAVTNEGSCALWTP